MLFQKLSYFLSFLSVDIDFGCAQPVLYRGQWGFLFRELSDDEL